MKRDYSKPRVVILGAGFGGVYTFLELRKRFSSRRVEITFVNRTNYFLFTPLLHEVATGSLAHHQVVESIRSITYKKGANLHVADIQSIDTVAKKVKTTIGDVPYDILVIATGASSTFYGIPGAAEHTLVLKTLREAIGIRNRFADAFERAIETSDPAERKRLLTFVLVGAGATGVELAGEMTDLFFETYSRFFCGKIGRHEISIHLVTPETWVLGNFNKSLQIKAARVLTKKGVKIHLGSRVVAVDGDGVTLADGSRINSEHVLWTAGVAPNVPTLASGTFMQDPKSKRIIVDEFLRVKGQEHVYALGDVATFEAKGLPMHAQVAVQAALVAARNIAAEICKKKPIPFVFKPKGDLVSVGQWNALGHIAGITWSGAIAWFIWRTVYLFKFASWPKRIKIAADWTVDLFYPRDITRA